MQRMARARSLLLALPAALLGGCSLDAWDMAGPMSWAIPKGTAAEIQIDLFNLTVYICTGIFLIVGGIYAYSLIKFRAKPGEEDEIPEQIHGNTALEIGLVVVFVVILTVIMVPNVKALFELDDVPGEDDALVIKAIGYQWWWGFEYPQLGVRTANELHMPVGQKVRIELESRDVIHSFWIPKLGGKVDVMPGQNNTMWLDADEPGKYYGQCAELCGASHANMRFLAYVDTEEQFDAWVEHQKSTAKAVTATADADPGQIAKGKQLFLSSACIGCHTVSGTHAMGRTGPDLSHFGSRSSMGAGIMENTPANVAAYILDPQGFKPGNIMPALGLPEEDAEAIAAYLTSLK